MPKASTPPRKSSTRKRAAPKVAFTAPGLSKDDGATTSAVLAERLVALLDLTATLKHIHWNVVGPGFIAVHEMLDPQYAGVADMVDATAERIAALGGEPNGLPGHLVAARTWDDYDLGRDSVQAHLGALDVVYAGVISAHREAIEAVAELDPITEDLLIGQTGTLEQYHWFVRAHLQNTSGVLSTQGESTERGAAKAARGR
ncbi:MAG TPA: DNA starvation/stationary phase protection protein [Ilumatobacter sp.]|nr:DNA starvation/stationary phase protection protein [Ilumatobacter sp.]